MTEFLFKLLRESEVELSEAPFSGKILLEKDISLSRKTWLIFLKREVEFLGVSEPSPTSIKIKTDSRKEYLVTSTVFPLVFVRSKEPSR